jgi:hypothetical protein
MWVTSKSSQWLGEVEGRASADSSGSQPPLSVGGHSRRQDVSDPECQDTVLSLAPEPVEQGGVGGGAEG